MADVPWFIQQVASTPAEAQALTALGAETPFHLAEILRIVGDAAAPIMDREARLRAIAQLSRMSPTLPPATEGPFPLGVPLTAPPASIPAPPYDIGRRDDLFRRLRAARERNAPAAEIDTLERELDRLMTP